MTTSQSFSSRIASLVAMRPRLQWLLVHNRTVLDHNTLWADARAHQFARLVDGLVTPLTRGGRRLQAVCFQFVSDHYLIVIHRGLCLCVILADAGDKLDETASVALSILEDCDDGIRKAAGIPEEPESTPAPAAVAAAPEPEPEPEPEPDDEPAWVAFRTHLTDVVCKILSRPQAERLITRELATLGIDGVPAAADFARIGRDVVAHVPHRAKQAALLAEVLHFLES